MPNNDEFVKIIGSLGFDLRPLERNVQRLDQLVNYMGMAAERLEQRFKKINILNIDSKNLAVQEKLTDLKYREAKADEAIASAKLKEARANEINLRQQSQQALIQERLARAGQAAIRTKQMEADLQNKLLQADNRRLQNLNQRQKLLERQIALEKGTSIGTAGRNSENEMVSNLDRRFGWFATGLAFYGVQSVFQQTLTAMGNVEMKMVEIQRVTEDSTASFSLMREELFKLGKDFGTNMATVQDIALRWAQAGYNVKDTLSLTKTSLLALNTAELDATQSTQAMIGIMAQWNLTAKDMPLIVDKINKTADDYAVSSQDLVDGLLRSSGAARIMGMTFNQLLGVLTATRESSGRTGREVGNAINSILSYVQRPTAIKTFERLGIKVFANEAKTEFRNVIEIMNDLASRWDDVSDDVKDGFVQAADEAGLFNEELATSLNTQEQWTDLQKRDLSQAAAGVYRRNYLIALLRNFAQVQEVVNNLQDAEGYSLKENDRTMTTYQKKVESLKVSLVELATAAGDAGLLGIMKDLADGARSAVDAFTELPPDIRNAIVLFVELASVVAVANLALRLFTGAGFGAGIMGIATAMRGAQAGAIGLGTALRIVLLNPLGLVIGAVGAATVAFNLYKKHQEEAVQQSLDAALKAQDQAKKITELTGRYDKLKGELDEGKDVQQEFNATLRELADIFPQVVTQWDSQGNAIAINNNLLRENIALAQEAVRANALSGLATAQKRLADLAEQREYYSSPTVEVFEGYPVIRDMSKASTELKRIEMQAGEASAAIARFNALLGNNEEYGQIGANLSGKGRRIPSSASSASTGGGSGGSSGSGSTKDSTNQALEAARGYIEAITEVLYPYESATKAVSAAVDLLGSKEQYLAQVMQSGQGTVYQATELEKVRAEQLVKLAEQQDKLSKQADAQRAIKAEVIAQYEVTADPEAAKLLRQEIDNLTQSTDQLSQAWWQAEQQKLSLMENVRQEEEKRHNDEYQEATDYMQHQVRMARMTTEQQIEYLDELRERHKWTQKQMWSTEEELFQLRRKQLNEYLSKLDDEYNSKIEKLEARENREIKKLQNQIDALDSEDEMSSREESERQHNEKLLDLDEQLNYHRLRTGREHQEKIAEIEQEIAEEKQQWVLQQEEWEREDRRQELQDQIEEIREHYEEERDELEEHYQRAKQITEKGVLDQIAALAATEPKWYKTGKKLIDELISGLESGDFDDVFDILDDITDAIEDAADAMDDLNNSSGGSGGGSGSGSGSKSPDDPWPWLPSKESDWLPGYDTGGPIYADQIARLHAPEYVLNAKTVSALGGFSGVERLVATVTTPKWSVPQGFGSDVTLLADRIVAAIERNPRIIQIEKMLNVENAEYGDGMDFDIQGRSLMRAVNSVLTARGQ